MKTQEYKAQQNIAMSRRRISKLTISQDVKNNSREIATRCNIRVARAA